MLLALPSFITFGFIAATITSFRRSYDRELFHAHRDRMTGTRSTRKSFTVAAQGDRRCGHNELTLLLIILDLDDFKAVNNREGHRAGDEVLQTFAKGASSIMRHEDLIGRIGGNEFALLVCVPSIAEARASRAMFTPACRRCWRKRVIQGRAAWGRC